MLSLQETLDTLLHALTERTEENASLTIDVSPLAVYLVQPARLGSSVASTIQKQVASTPEIYKQWPHLHPVGSVSWKEYIEVVKYIPSNNLTGDKSASHTVGQLQL